MNARCIQLIAQERANWPPAGTTSLSTWTYDQETCHPGRDVASARRKSRSLTFTITVALLSAFNRRYSRDAGVFVNTGEERHLSVRGIYGRVAKDGVVSVGKVAKLGSRPGFRARGRVACR
jgi:hypothetical protein